MPLLCTCFRISSIILEKSHREMPSMLSMISMSSRSSCDAHPQLPEHISAGGMESCKYLSMLKSLDDNLASQDLVVFKFLCQDIIKTSRLDNVKCPLDLFDALGTSVRYFYLSRLFRLFQRVENQRLYCYQDFFVIC